MTDLQVYQILGEGVYITEGGHGENTLLLHSPRYTLAYTLDVHTHRWNHAATLPIHGEQGGCKRSLWRSDYIYT